MDTWSEHLLWHLIGFFVFTLPVTWGLAYFVLNVPYLSVLPGVILGAGIVIVGLGFAKCGVPGWDR